jgi:hypothetical protein
MNWKRILTLVAIGGALAALVTSAATTGRRRAEIAPDDDRQTRSAEISGAALAAEIARLRERLHPTTTPQVPARNLFEFHLRSATRAVAPTAAVPAAVDEVPPPPPPAITLIGLAADPDVRDPSATIRTAIVSASGQLFLVKEGETVMSRYRVAKISEAGVELADLDTATTVRLALK